MGAMRYVLTASEKAFKEAVREFVVRAIPDAGDGRLPGPGVLETFPRGFGKWLVGSRPAGLSRVEEAVALEEILRRCPALAPGLVTSGLLGARSPGLCRAAADLGAAQGVLGPGLPGVSNPEAHRGDLLQCLADTLAGIEVVRLQLYRAAILEDTGRGDAEESAGAERLARGLARQVEELMERITTGGNNETGSAVPGSDRNGHRQ